eukprot:Sspe_Gene.64107::Locus_37497_Transcript_1_1_Confidence_1.000_Length_1423::g.64107::m.64107/K20367/ERGIC3, ERV46; endoplasmic reticulum-Golgi intermediate compartment protein 3
MTSTLSHRKPKGPPEPLSAEEEPRLFRTVKQFDLYPKVKKDARRKQTLAGSVISISVTGVLALMLVVEFGHYLLGTDAYHTRLAVDTGISERVPINLNITLYAIPCVDLHLSMIDAGGDMQLDVDHDLTKRPVDKDGHILPFLPVQRATELMYAPAPPPEEGKEAKGHCGQCEPGMHINFFGLDIEVGAKNNNTECCNTCRDVMRYHKAHGKELPEPENVEQCVYEMSARYPGCNVGGVITTQKVKGNFHFAPGKSLQSGLRMVHLYTASAAQKFNVTHRIHHLSFGDTSVERFSEMGTPRYPLDGHYHHTPELETVKYLIKVIPVVYSRDGSDETDAAKHGELLGGKIARTASYEFSANSLARGVARSSQGRTQQAPGLFFVYDFHPIEITHVFQRPPFPQFLVDLCKIIGGLFVVSGCGMAELALGE